MDVKKIRTMFPFLRNNPQDIYFDNGATTLKPESVINAEADYLAKIGANPHANDYQESYEANEILFKTRQSVAKFINVNNPEEIIFTSGATMSLNIVANGLKDFINKDDEIFVTTLEHSSDMLPWLIVAKEKGAKIREIPLDKDMKIDADQLAKLITNKTKVVAFASVSNTIGAVNDVKAITSRIKAANIDTIVSVDLAQSIAHFPTDIQDWGIDFASFSAHKIYGPFGLGILWGKMSLLNKLKPLIYGGGMSESISFKSMDYTLYPVPEKFEAGTPNISAIYAFNSALDFVNKIGMKNIQNHEKELKDYAVKRIKELKLNDTVEFYNLDNESPILLFNVKGLNSQDISAYLSADYHIDTRSGAHCARTINDVIKTKVTVRASFAIYNTVDEVEKLLFALTKKDDFLNHLFK